MRDIEHENYIINELKAGGLNPIPVGSLVTCNPPPENTDADYLILCDSEQYVWLGAFLQTEHFRFDGSRVANSVNYIPEADRFESYKWNDTNLIITRSPVFHKRFLAASHVAKRLNLLSKPDRVALFQAVLYANQWTENTVKQEDPIAAFEFANPSHVLVTEG